MAHKTSTPLLLAVALFAPLALTACNPDQLITAFNDQVGHRIGVKLETTAKPTPTPVATATQEATPSDTHRQVNAAFIRELFKVVLQRDVRSQEEFEKFMNVMDQGGHYEGIYNGIVYSSEYKDKEKGVAPVSAVKTYAEIMAQIQLDQKYDPLRIQKPEGDHLPGTQNELVPPQPTDVERIGLIGDFERQAMTLPLYSLKRKLGEEVIKTIELKREYKEKFATWYGRFTVFLNKKGVDFGVALRNRPDEYYHYKWALEAEDDRLRWESLNRIHVLMNSYAK